MTDKKRKTLPLGGSSLQMSKSQRLDTTPPNDKQEETWKVMVLQSQTIFKDVIQNITVERNTAMIVDALRDGALDSLQLAATRAKDGILLENDAWKNVLSHWILCVSVESDDAAEVASKHEAQTVLWNVMKDNNVHLYVNAPINIYASSLHMAVDKGQYHCFGLLLSLDESDLNQRNDDKNTPLMSIISNHISRIQLRCIEYVLEHYPLRLELFHANQDGKTLTQLIAELPTLQTQNVRLQDRWNKYLHWIHFYHRAIRFRLNLLFMSDISLLIMKYLDTGPS